MTTQAPLVAFTVAVPGTFGGVTQVYLAKVSKSHRDLVATKNRRDRPQP